MTAPTPRRFVAVAEAVPHVAMVVSRITSLAGAERHRETTNPEESQHD